MHNPIIYKKIGINIISPTTSVCDHSSFPKEENRDRIDFLVTPPMEILLFDSFFIRFSNAQWFASPDVAPDFNSLR